MSSSGGISGSTSVIAVGWGSSCPGVVFFIVCCSCHFSFLCFGLLFACFVFSPCNTCEEFLHLDLEEVCNICLRCGELGEHVFS